MPLFFILHDGELERILNRNGYFYILNLSGVVTSVYTKKLVKDDKLILKSEN